MAKEIHEEGLISRTLKEISQPFKDLFHTSRALFGLNLSYLIEGFTYFGVLGYLTLFFNDYVGLNDINAGQMVGVLTAGITLSMLFLGATVDWIGLRRALIYALSFMVAGRVLLSAAPSIGVSGLWGSTHIFSMLGIFGIVIGYGIYQPAAYAGVKKLTTEKTAAMGYAMLYALMNLGGFLPGIIAPAVRKHTSMLTMMWVYAIITVVGIAVVYFIITKKAYNKAVDDANKEKNNVEEEDTDELGKMTFGQKVEFYIKNFPLRDLRFLFFIFILIPVQTLFAHNWLTLPAYFKRAFEGTVSEYFEFFTNFNPVLIFVLTPIVTALTSKKNTYKMMIIGTFVMAAPAFFLSTGPSMAAVFAYLVVMSIGEAMWQPRFLQWVAEIAPKNMTGIYMGIGQFPWFLTKIITSLYSGWFLMNYCPDNTLPSQMNTGTMWMIYGFIALVSPAGLFLARSWMMKGFKTKHE